MLRWLASDHKRNSELLSKATQGWWPALPCCPGLSVPPDTGNLFSCRLGDTRAPLLLWPCFEWPSCLEWTFPLLSLDSNLRWFSSGVTRSRKSLETVPNQDEYPLLQRVAHRSVTDSPHSVVRSQGGRNCSFSYLQISFSTAWRESTV